MVELREAGQPGILACRHEAGGCPVPLRSVSFLTIAVRVVATDVGRGEPAAHFYGASKGVCENPVSRPEQGRQEREARLRR